MILRYVFGGNDYECGDNYDFEVDYLELREALKVIIEEDFKVDKDNVQAEKLISFIIDDLDIEYTLLEIYEEKLKEYFEDKAYEAYEDAKLYEKDPLGYYGISQKDFI